MTHCSFLLTFPFFLLFFFFFFNDTATTEIYTLSLHDALPILILSTCNRVEVVAEVESYHAGFQALRRDRKSTRLNSSHMSISYAVFCLKKKKKKIHKNKHDKTIMSYK